MDKSKIAYTEEQKVVYIKKFPKNHAEIKLSFF